MPIDPSAEIEITAFRWVPPFAAGLVRDQRLRWALEEIGLPYRVRLLGFERPADYVKEQPFDQVPTYREGELLMFETGAIVQHIGEKDERLLPRDPVGRMRAIQWCFAALNSVEPAITNFSLIDIFYADQEWAKLRRSGAEEFARLKLKRVADWLGTREWLEDRFTIGDLLMVTVLRNLRQTDLVNAHPVLGPYLARGEARPAFQRALADQLATFAEHQPQGEPA
ncbi:glutathione S-transferase family protein [Sphingomonas mesophila]|uniref:glutathione S-transferase family protein n=1 Tax=Sphingomonas mesophila TaxID=2303576 RepID=UPI000E56B728|nr:glutathione S-transferase family protein [Sphingomonas mesophila]